MIKDPKGMMDPALSSESVTISVAAAIFFDGRIMSLIVHSWCMAE
jgi:hypothetical protein